jgi:hypothetical protein
VITRGVPRRDQAEKEHQLPRAIETGQITDFGNQSHGIDSAQLAAFGDRIDILLKDGLRMLRYQY